MFTINIQPKQGAPPHTIFWLYYLPNIRTSVLFSWVHWDKSTLFLWSRLKNISIFSTQKTSFMQFIRENIIEIYLNGYISLLFIWNLHVWMEVLPAKRINKRKSNFQGLSANNILWSGDNLWKLVLTCTNRIGEIECKFAGRIYSAWGRTGYSVSS